MKTLKITTKELDSLLERKEDLRLSQTYYHDSRRQTLIDHLVKEISELWEEMASPVEEALKEVNGRAETHTITRFAEVHRLATRAENQLAASGLSKSERIGAVLEYRPAGPSANAYKYAAVATKLVLLRVTDGWRLKNVCRDSVFPKQAEMFEIHIDQETAEIIKKKALSGYKVEAEICV